jgi:hypothetical protein
MSNIENTGSTVKDAELVAAVTAAKGRGIAPDAIRAVIRKYSPSASASAMPLEQRPAFLTALTNLVPPAQTPPVADFEQTRPIVEALLEISKGHPGKWSIFSFREGVKSPDVEHIPNQGEAVFLIEQFRSKMQAMAAQEGSNVQLPCSLVLDSVGKRKRGTIKEVTGQCAIVLDLDYGNYAASNWETKLDILPSFVTQTSSIPGPSLQPIFILDKPYQADEVRPIAEALVEIYGSDATQSAEHGIRAPGFPNNPNKRKRTTRSRVPENSTLLRDNHIAGHSLDSIKAAILAKHPDALKPKATEPDVEVDFEKRLAETFNPLPDETITDILNSPPKTTLKPEGDNGEGRWILINRALRHGHTGQEITEILMAHRDTACMSKYTTSDAETEKRVCYEVERALKKFVPTTTANSAIAKGRININAVEFPDVNHDTGNPKSTCSNTRVAIKALGVTCEHDLFRGRLIIGGHALGSVEGDLTDNAIHMLRVLITETFGFDPRAQNTRDAAEQLSLQNPFDPILDYLAEVQPKWDGTKRIGTWLIDIAKAADTPLTREISRLSLIAAVRRARQPGCKFDPIIVLESPEGKNKSTAIEILAGKDFFSDQTILGVKDREAQENLQGIWLYEIADLTNIHKSDVDTIKAAASRTVDRARPAYGHYLLKQPRRCVLFATTNNDHYLKSTTGNRRWWPVAVGRIDLDALRRDRDQLWAEAAHEEATGCSIFLPEELWAIATIEQAERQEIDPWEDILAAVKGSVVVRNRRKDTEGGYEERIASSVVMVSHLRIDLEKQTNFFFNRVKTVMRKLGWEGPTVMLINGISQRGYVRPCDPPPAPEPEIELNQKIDF